MRILLADNQTSVRSAIRLLLEQQPEMNIIEEVSDAQELMDYVNNYCPDMLLLDWDIPGKPPEKLLMKLRDSYPNLIIIALNSSPQTRQAALGAGASEFVSKNDPPEYLLAAVRNTRIKGKK